MKKRQLVSGHMLDPQPKAKTSKELAVYARLLYCRATLMVKLGFKISNLLSHPAVIAPCITIPAPT